MAGRHAAPRRWNISRYLLPIVTTVGVLAIVMTVSGAGNVLRRFPAGAPASAPVSDETTAPAPTRSSPSRASRHGEPDSAQRAAPSSPAPRSSRSSSSPSGGRVTSTGSCQASFYDEGQQTANGERFDPDALTAAHKSLPFHTRVRVTNPANGKSVVVRINDRGPYVSGRCLDLSRAAFQAIASLSAGHTFVRYEVLARR